MGARRLAGWVVAVLLAVPAAALAAPDSPDPGFGAGGVVVTGFPARTVQAAGMLLDRAGQPVVAAKTGAMELGVLRLRPDGAADPAFPPRLIALGAGVDSRLGELAEQADGRYVAGGWIEAAGGDRRFALARLLPDGMLDPGFGVRIDGAAGDEIGALAIDPQQRIVAAGRAGERIAVARYGDGGIRDTTFGGARDLGGIDAEEAGGVLVEPAGRIVVAGTGVAGGERRVVVTALTSAGAADATFAGGGAVTLDVGDGVAAVRALARQPDGRLLVAGATDARGGGDGFVARLLPDGTPDATFGGDGVAQLGVAGAVVEDVAVQPDGKVVAVGAAAGDSLVARFRPGGARDPGFGADGVARRSLGPAGADALTGVGIAAGGAIVAGGPAGGSVVLAALTGGDSGDPALAMTADGLGDTVTFTVSATNRGADPARDVRIDVAPPADLAARALTMRGGACSGTSCLVGELAPGATARVTLLARAATPGPLAAAATVTSATFDSDPANNAASAAGAATRNRVVRADRTDPVVRLGLARRSLASSRRRLSLRVRTSERVSVRLTARAKGVARLARARRVGLRRAGAHRVALRLTPAGRRAVARALRRTGAKRKRLAVVVTARATDPSGNAVTKRRRLTLRG